jgi:CRP-like cAMP-binding protein
MALIDDWVRTASVIAKTDLKVLSLHHWNLRQEMEGTPAIAVELLQMLTRRIRSLEKNFTETLAALLPLCNSCQTISRAEDRRDASPDLGEDSTVAELGHGLCEACSKKIHETLYRRE